MVVSVNLHFQDDHGGSDLDSVVGKTPQNEGKQSAAADEAVWVPQRISQGLPSQELQTPKPPTGMEPHKQSGVRLQFSHEFGDWVPHSLTQPLFLF